MNLIQEKYSLQRTIGVLKEVHFEKIDKNVLVELNLQYCCISDVNILSSHLIFPQLKVINLDHNRLISFPQFIDSSINLPKLEIFSASHNKIVNISPFLNLSNLKQLLLSHNLIRQLTPFYSTFTQSPIHSPFTKHSNDKQQELTQICKEYYLPNLHTFDLSYNRLSDIQDILVAIQKLPKLKYFIFNGNEKSLNNYNGINEIEKTLNEKLNNKISPSMLLQTTLPHLNIQHKQINPFSRLSKSASQQNKISQYQIDQPKVKFQNRNINSSSIFREFHMNPKSNSRVNQKLNIGKQIDDQDSDQVDNLEKLKHIKYVNKNKRNEQNNNQNLIKYSNLNEQLFTISSPQNHLMSHNQHQINNPDVSYQTQSNQISFPYIPLHLLPPPPPLIQYMEQQPNEQQQIDNQLIEFENQTHHTSHNKFAHEQSLSNNFHSSQITSPQLQASELRTPQYILQQFHLQQKSIISQPNEINFNSNLINQKLQDNFTSKKEYSPKTEQKSQQNQIDLKKRGYFQTTNTFAFLLKLPSTYQSKTRDILQRRIMEADENIQTSPQKILEMYKMKKYF